MLRGGGAGGLGKGAIKAIDQALNAKDMPAVRKHAIRGQLAAAKKAIVDADKARFQQAKQVAVERAKELIALAPAVIVEELPVHSHPHTRGPAAAAPASFTHACHAQT